GVLWLLSGAPESNNIASAEATGAAKKIKKAKAGKIQRRECKTSFSALPIATAPPVCYNNQAPKGAKEGVFNAEQ
ncbi:MAG: hypothetical protein UDR59_09860, partial [Christensenellales bacterium]|nr:hypothetical protein [Christensenellales bacterium]